MERWRKPILPDAVEEDIDTVWFDGSRYRTNVTWVLRAEDVERVRTGHACLRCYDGVPESFPVACPTCGYAMKRLQAEDFAREFVGLKHVGPSTSLKQEMEALDEKTERRIWTPRPSAVVPRAS